MGTRRTTGLSLFYSLWFLPHRSGVRYSLKVLLLLLYTNIEENITVPIAVVLFIPCALPHTLFVPLSVPLKRRITMPFRYTALPGSLISVQLYLRREAKDRTSRRRSEEDVHSNDDRSVESLS